MRYVSGLNASSNTPDQQAEIYGLMRTFAILCYVLQVPVIPYVDCEGPDQTARMRRLIWAFAVRIRPKTCLHTARPVLRGNRTYTYIKCFNKFSTYKFFIYFFW